MTDNTTFKEKAMDSAIALIFAVIIFICTSIYFSPGIITVSPAFTPFMVFMPESVTETQIQDYAGIQKTYTYDLTDAANSINGNPVFIYLHHNMAVLEIDGHPLADTTEAKDIWHIGHTPGGYWLKIRMRPDYAGKKMTLTLTPVYKSATYEEPEPMMIERETLLRFIVWPQEGLLFTLSIIALVIGLFLMVLSMIMGLAPHLRRRVFYLGSIAVTAGAWKFFGLSIVPLLFDHYGKAKLFWYAGIMSYMLMLVLSLRLLDVIHGENNNRTNRLCCIVGASITLILFVLQIVGVVDIHEVVIPFGICMGVLHLLTLLQKPGSSELSWLIPSFAALGIDGLILLRTGHIKGAPVLIIWIIVNLFVQGFGYLRRSVRSEKILRQKEEELQQARIQTMINQIRPHFIYNTLSSISMICDSDPKRAMEVTDNFNHYLQANFSAIATTDPVPFAAELEHTKAYLGVQTALYMDKLKVEYNTEFMDFKLPPLTLQPIVENSIKHGIAQTHQTEHIIISTSKTDQGTTILVEDDGPGFTDDDFAYTNSEAHIGINNVTLRLQIMCGGTLNITPRQEGGTIVTILIP